MIFAAEVQCECLNRLADTSLIAKHSKILCTWSLLYVYQGGSIAAAPVQLMPLDAGA